ncbi:MAG TPA: transglutaminase-like domain-containing protein [Promineifilum sp.]|nr:transglutaminase-like domain-containing protein [Promineifilum sp.]
MGKWMFRDELQLAEINVPRAALQFARAIAYPDLNVAAYMLRLHEISEEAGDYVSSERAVHTQAEQLASFLFDHLAFRGDREEYNDPRNSFLNDVLDRRLGIPITLSILYVDIAARLGIPAFGIGLPGHFIVGIHGQNADLWLDPFHGGRRLNLNDCAELIRISSGYEGPLEAGWFAPAPARDIIARMLGNLRSSYVGAGLWAQAATAIQLLRQVQPDTSEHLRDLGLVYYHQHRLPLAAHYLNAYLLREPNASDAQVIRDGIKQLLDEWVPLN